MVSPEKKIGDIPEPYKNEFTPYKKTNFSELTVERCIVEKYNHDSWRKICKVVVIGDVSVGKTCIVNRFCQKIFDSNYKSTIGVDFEIQNFNVLGVPFSLQIWDTAGQERFKSMAHSYYRGAGVIMVVFDLTNFDSLSNCKNWLFAALNANATFTPLIFLVGTKMDLLKPYALKNVERLAAKIAKHMEAEYWTVSSKNGTNIDNLFLRIAALGFEESVKKEAFEERKKTIKIGQMSRENRYSETSTSRSRFEECVKCQIN